MKLHAIQVGWCLAAAMPLMAAAEADEARLREALQTALHLPSHLHVVLYRTPRPLVDSSSPIIEQQELQALFDLVPTSDLGADDPPQRRLFATLHAAMLAARAGRARWTPEQLAELEAARGVILRPERAVDLLRGVRLPTEASIRLEAYLRRLSRADYRPSGAFVEEDAAMREALQLTASNGPDWPSRKRGEALDLLAHPFVLARPAPRQWLTPEHWLGFDIASHLGRPVQALEMLRVQLIYPGVNPEFLYGRWWDTTPAALARMGLPDSLSAGELPAPGEGGARVPAGALPWVPREAILLRPASGTSSAPSSGFMHLDLRGPCLVGLVCEILNPLPQFDEDAFYLP